MRNPFRKQDENAPPLTATDDSSNREDAAGPIDVVEKDPVEYQLSEINDSGVYLPPSPIERKSFWGTTSSRSTTSSSLHRPVYDANEPFNMSRESFDSYRRSFDISARSPIMQPMESRQRSSLDSRTFQPLPRSSNSFQRPLQVPQTQAEEDDRFEDVNIDEPKPLQQPPKKRGIFARMVDAGGNSGNNNNSEGELHGRPVSSHEKTSSWHHFGVGGRKRGQSGQGSELGSIPFPPPQRDDTPKPEKQTQHIAPPQVPANNHTPTPSQSQPRSQNKQQQHNAPIPPPAPSSTSKSDIGLSDPSTTSATATVGTTATDKIITAPATADKKPAQAQEAGGGAIAGTNRDSKIAA